ncbi:MAG: condensation domain-containing protein [bacterium]
MTNKEKNPAINTLVDLLKYRVQHQAQKMAYTFLRDGEIPETTYHFAELDRQARMIAAHLQQTMPMGSRALLLYPNGVEYIAAFFGCLYAGVIAVPVYPPRRNRSDRRLKSIAEDTNPRIILTTSEIKKRIENKKQLQFVPELKTYTWLATDELADSLADAWQAPAINGETLAFLQYTSGSTGQPKGVMVSHANLLQNLFELSHTFDFTQESIMVTWLPIFHDMGLIYGVLGPLYSGHSCYIMMPAAFLQKPFRWLKALSDFKGTHTSAPNFAYDLCVQRAQQEQWHDLALDLSQWRVAMNGAEPVRKETLSRFQQTFAPYGFRESALCPGYGLAEATLMLSAINAPDHWHCLSINADALSRDQINILPEVLNTTETGKSIQAMSCGTSEPDVTLRIVHPQTKRRCLSHQVGEIWAKGASIAKGYWQNPQATAETFQARILDDSDSDVYMRTGDLGFIHNNELYITGRLKDVIVIRGANYYPNDIEQTVEQSHHALSASGAAAFAITVKGDTQLVVMQEVKRTALKSFVLDEVVQAVREAVAEQHALSLSALILIKPATLPKTSSGKVQRSACRQAFIDKAIDKEVARWEKEQPILSADKTSQVVTTSTSLWLQRLDKASAFETLLLLHQCVLANVRQLLRVNELAQLDVTTQFSQLGMDSLQQVELSRLLSEQLAVDLPATTMFEYASISQLVQHLARHYWQIPLPNEFSGNDLAAEHRVESSTDQPLSSPSVAALQPVSREQDLPLSFVQRRYWFHQATEPSACFHNVPWVLQLQGHVSPEVLQATLNALLARHESLRTQFPLKNHEPIQHIMPAQHTIIALAYQDWRDLDPTVQQQHLEAELRQHLSHQPFDLQRDLLWRAVLCQKAEQDFVLVMSFHHIIIDIQSLFLLTKELAALYTAISNGESHALPEPPIQYVDYAVWQRSLLDDAALAQRYAYWQQWLAKGEPPNPILTDYPRTHETYQTQRLDYQLASTRSHAIKQLAKQQSVSALVIGLTGLLLVLYQRDQCDDIVIGTTFSYREHRQLQSMIGSLTSVLQLRFQLQPQQTLRALIQHVQQVVQQAIIAQDVPFQQIAEHYAMPTQQAASVPFFRVLFTFLPDIADTYQADDLMIRPLDQQTGFVIRPDLVLWMKENHDMEQTLFQGFWRYREDLFKQETVAEMADQWSAKVGQLGVSLDQSIAQLTATIVT